MVTEKTHKTPLVFYRSASGAEPVRDWLKALAAADRLEVGQDLMRAQWRWPVGMPLCRPMGQGLWEVRTELPSRRIARVLRGCCYAWMKAHSWRCTLSSRRHRRHPLTNCYWPESARRS